MRGGGGVNVGFYSTRTNHKKLWHIMHLQHIHVECTHLYILSMTHQHHSIV